MIIEGKNGYDICYQESIPDPDSIIIALHGFAGDKESSCISMLEKTAKTMGIGLVKFDWPAHGESKTNGFNLTIDNCLSDLDTVIKYVQQRFPTSKLLAFATSFGGYLTLLYNYKHPEVFDHILLRSPAIRMGKVMSENILKEETKQEELKKNGFVNEGFERVIEVTEDFVQQLNEHDVLKLYENKWLNNISIIHGTADDLVPFSDSEKFAKDHGCTLYPVVGADHRYKKDGELERVMDIAVKVFHPIRIAY